MHELVHTSLPKGLFGGTGYVVAAATRDMPESLRQALQGISNLEDSTPGVTWSSQFINAAGGTWLVLSRLQPALADHTGRSNYIAHHVALSFTHDARTDPASVLKNHKWIASWSGEPRWLDQSPVPAPLPQASSAKAWQHLGFDPGWAGYLATAQGTPIPILYPESLTNPLPLVLDALSLLSPSDRWQVAFNTRANGFTRSPGWWWARTDSAKAGVFRRQPGLVDLTSNTLAPGDEALIWQLRGKSRPNTISTSLRSTPNRSAVRLSKLDTNEDAVEPALPADKSKPWPLLAAAALVGLFGGLLSAGLFAFTASDRANTLQAQKQTVEASKAEVEKNLADVKAAMLTQEKDCQDKAKKQIADSAKEVETIRIESEQAFERSRVLSALLDWNGTEEELKKSLTENAGIPAESAKKYAESKLVTRMKGQPVGAREMRVPRDFVGLKEGQIITLEKGMQANLADAADVLKKKKLIEQALSDPKGGPKLVYLDSKDIPELAKFVTKDKKPLDETLQGLEKSANTDPQVISVTPGEWRTWINNERTLAKGDRFVGEIAWSSLVGKNLADSTWVSIAQVRKFFSSIRGTTGPKGQKMEAKSTRPFNLLRDFSNLMRDEESRQQAFALTLADKEKRDKLLTALGNLDARFDSALDGFVNEVPPQPVWLLHDEIRNARDYLRVLDKAIPKAGDIPPEERKKLRELTEKIYKRLGELGEHNLDNWIIDGKKEPMKP
jgi:hypothetical protein